MGLCQRRSILRLALIATIVAAVPTMSASQSRPAAAPPAGPGLELPLPGIAGGPLPHIDRSQPTSLLQVEGKSYLIDAGRDLMTIDIGH